jgi:hypothetical protein
LLSQAHKHAGKPDAAREAMCKARALGHAQAAEHCRLELGSSALAPEPDRA